MTANPADDLARSRDLARLCDLTSPHLPTPASRLRAVAGYLGIDWLWLQGRCQQLAQAGTAAQLPHLHRRGRRGVRTLAGLARPAPDDSRRGDR